MSRVLHQARESTVAALFLFWAVQVCVWLAVMLVAALHPKLFTSSLLFTVEISLWALELTACVGTVGAWALVQAKHNTHRLAAMHTHVERTANAVLGDAEQIEQDIARLASMQPGADGDRLAQEILARFAPRTDPPSGDRST